MDIGRRGFLIFAAAGIVFADETACATTFAAFARAEFHRAQNQYQSDANDATNAWQFARACFDFADFRHE